MLIFRDWQSQASVQQHKIRREKGLQNHDVPLQLVHVLLSPEKNPNKTTSSSSASNAATPSWHPIRNWDPALIDAINAMGPWSKNDNWVLGMFCQYLSEEVNLITFHQWTLVIPEVNIAPFAEQYTLFNVNFMYLICYQGSSRWSYRRIERERTISVSELGVSFLTNYLTIIPRYGTGDMDVPPTYRKVRKPEGFDNPFVEVSYSDL